MICFEFLKDAVICGLYLSEKAIFRESRTWSSMSLGEAVAKGLIAGEASIVTNPANGERMTLAEALREDVIDGRTGRFAKAGSLERSITIRQAINMGLIENAYKSDSSDVMNKKSGDVIPLQDAIKSELVDRTVTAVYDFSSKKRISILRALELGIMCRDDMSYREFSAVNAARHGLISLPGAPILASDDGRDGRRLTKTDRQTGITAEKGAKLQEKVNISVIIQIYQFCQ